MLQRKLFGYASSLASYSAHSSILSNSGDNQSAIALAYSDMGQFHARTKHIDICYHFIRYVIENNSIRLIYCPTNDMVADTFTKALPSTKAKHFAAALGLRSV